MKIKMLFLSLLVWQSASHAGALEQVLCKQFYMNSKSKTVVDLLTEKASDNMMFPIESYYPYLNKMFPEFSNVELIMLMAQMNPEQMTYAQISAKGAVSPRAQFYSKYTPNHLVISRRLLKTSGSSEITLDNVQALADYLYVHESKPDIELYTIVRNSLTAGLQRGYTTAQILANLPK